MAEGKTLGELRREVDAIDDALHDLLMRRAALTDGIARTKPRVDGRIPLARAMRPAREAEIMRRLMARHDGSLPLATVIRVVREILAASLAAQVPFRLHVFAGTPEFTRLAHEYFGAGVPLTLHQTESRVMHACGDDPDSIGIVPAPEAGGEAWWARLAPAGGSGPRVFANLPFVAAGSPGLRALAIAAIEQEATGDDTTLVLAEVDAALSRTRLISQLKDAGIVARPIAVAPAEGRTQSPVLMEVEGFVAANDPRLAAFCASANISAAAIFPVGGYANPVTVKAKEAVS